MMFFLALRTSNPEPAMYDDYDPFEDEEDDDEVLDIAPAELVEAIKNSLAYLVAEGLVVQKGDRYRLKTEEEIEQELRDIENE